MKKWNLTRIILGAVLLGIIILAPQTGREQVSAYTPKSLTVNNNKGTIYIPVGYKMQLTLGTESKILTENHVSKKPWSSNEDNVAVVTKRNDDGVKCYYIKAYQTGKATISYRDNDDNKHSVKVKAIPKLKCKVVRSEFTTHNGYYAYRIDLKNNSSKAFTVMLEGMENKDGNTLGTLSGGSKKITPGKTGTIWYYFCDTDTMVRSFAEKYYKPSGIRLAYNYRGHYYLNQYSSGFKLKRTTYFDNGIRSYIDVSNFKGDQVKSLKLKKSGNIITVSAQSLAGVSGYQVEYVRDGGKTQRSFHRTSKFEFRGIRGRTYTIRIRAYKTDSSGNKQYGHWSERKSITL